MEAKNQNQTFLLSDNPEELKREVEARYFRRIQAIEGDQDTFNVTVSEEVFLSVKEETLKTYYREPEESTSRLQASPSSIGSTLLLLFGCVGMLNDVTSTISALAALPFAVPAGSFIVGAVWLRMVFKR